MEIADNRQKRLCGKILFSGVLTVETGMHIGASSDFAPIGSVDTPFVRDVLTQEPIIPGSSLKGKLRTLLARNQCDNYLLNDIGDDNLIIKRLFGSVNPVQQARLQFYDLFVTEESKELFSNIDTDTFMGEVKFENTIKRFSGEANPRQIERVPAGMKFNFKLVYNVECEEDFTTDLKALKDGLTLLETDYLGGHGSRGYGRVNITINEVKTIGHVETTKDVILSVIK